VRASRSRLLAASAVALPVALLAAVGTAFAVDRMVDDGPPVDAELRFSADDTVPPDGSDAAGSYLPHESWERFGGGGTASLADYAGSPLVLNFFASYCVPCAREMPALQRVADELRERVADELRERVAVVGMNLADEEDAAEALVEQTGVTYDLGRDPDGDLAEALEVVNLPTTVFATPDHRVVEVHTGALDEDQLREKMTRLLESA
jgi:cytochrome c biogenesis protein CcmG/thiol:disulfide interchange protein DsbE